MSRIQNIITRIRTTLKDFTEDNIKDQTLLVQVENVIKDFLKRTECVEGIKDISVTSSGEVINAFDSSKMPIVIKIENSNGENISYIEFSKFNDYKLFNGSSILFYTSFSNILFFAPKCPDTVKAYYYVNTQVITDVNSELVYPEDYDHIIALGVIAQYNNDYINYYEQQVELIRGNSKLKTTETAVPTARW